VFFLEAAKTFLRCFIAFFYSPCYETPKNAIKQIRGRKVLFFFYEPRWIFWGKKIVFCFFPCYLLRNAEKRHKKIEGGNKEKNENEIKQATTFFLCCGKCGSLSSIFFPRPPLTFFVFVSCFDFPLLFATNRTTAGAAASAGAAVGAGANPPAPTIDGAGAEPTSPVPAPPAASDPTELEPALPFGRPHLHRWWIVVGKLGTISVCTPLRD
jgi:hypothetical protein